MEKDKRYIEMEHEHLDNILRKLMKSVDCSTMDALKVFISSYALLLKYVVDENQYVKFANSLSLNDYDLFHKSFLFYTAIGQKLTEE